MILVRMAALLAARNVFGALFALLSTAAAIVSLAWTLLLQTRMLMLVRHGIAYGDLAQFHFAAVMMLGCFVSLTFLTPRPYFSVQASRVLSALVFLPFPLYCLILAQELFRLHAPLAAAVRVARGAGLLRSRSRALLRHRRPLHPASAHVHRDDQSPRAARHAYRPLLASHR
jgi:hypothetical protein